MKKNINKIFWLGFFFLILWVFRSWFSLEEISSGDTGFYFLEALKSFPVFPHLWFDGGLGSYNSLLYFFPYIILPLRLLSSLNFPWVLIERMAWYWPFLPLSLFSSYYLYKTVLPEAKLRFLASFIYLFNTYILMIVGGGQASIFLSYAIAPLVLSLFIQLINDSKTNDKWPVKKVILTGMILAVQVSFEPRLALVTLIAVGGYFLLQLFKAKLRMASLAKNLGTPLIITFLLHFYWLFPSLILRKASFSTTLASEGWAEFLSFAQFSNSLSLLHPNWPENIFGKTYFFRPEFLLLPILAFGALLFSQRSKNLVQKKNLLFFALLGLMGAFLAKGTNPPFGEVYLWLFKNVPGMNLFRDASKFYLLTALSYSVLIPFSLSKIHKRLRTKNIFFNTKQYLPRVFLLLVFCYFLLLIKPAWTNQLGGTFKTKEIPNEYLVLKEFLNSQPEFFRTFWVPKQQRFGFSSHNHPIISSENFSTDTVCLEPFCSLRVAMPENWGKECFPNDRCYVKELSFFLNPQTESILKAMAVKYVVVPFDFEGEIFIAERQYNHQQREEVEKFLDTISWLKKVEVAEKIAVYQVSGNQDHFFLTDASVIKSIKMINPTKYLVSVEIDQPSVTLVFSETYDELWQAKIGRETIPSQPYFGVLNSFFIEQAGDLEVVVEFSDQKYVYWGGVVSLLTFFLSGGYLLFAFRQRKT